MNASRAPNERKVDKDTLGKLKGEAPGILRWMMQGCLSCKKDVQQPPQSVLQVGSRRSGHGCTLVVNDLFHLGVNFCLRHPQAVQGPPDHGLSGQKIDKALRQTKKRIYFKATKALAGIGTTAAFAAFFILLGDMELYIRGKKTVCTSSSPEFQKQEFPHPFTQGRLS